MDKLKNIGFVSFISLFVKHVKERGIFALVRYHDGEVQTHIDWDCDQYGELTDQAKTVKRERANRSHAESKTTSQEQ